MSASSLGRRLVISINGSLQSLSTCPGVTILRSKSLHGRFVTQEISYLLKLESTLHKSKDTIIYFIYTSSLLHALRSVDIIRVAQVDSLGNMIKINFSL